MDNELTGVLTEDTEDTSNQTNEQTNDTRAEGTQVYADAVAQARAELEAEANARWQAEQERQAEARAAQPYLEALQQGEEYGDWSALGQLAAENLKQAATAHQVATASEEAARNRLDAVIQNQYSDALAALTEDEAAALARHNFPTLEAQTEAVFNFLSTRRASYPARSPTPAAAEA